MMRNLGNVIIAAAVGVASGIYIFDDAFRDASQLLKQQQQQQSTVVQPQEPIVIEKQESQPSNEVKN